MSCVRLHGDREPHSEPLGASGGGMCPSGADNEVWSYGEEAYQIFKKYMQMRERLRPYLRRIMEEAHEKGTPLMRPLFYNFSYDLETWKIEDAYMFGPDLLVAPVMNQGQRSRTVYLPNGCKWTNAHTGTVHEGGTYVECDAPLDTIPLFMMRGCRSINTRKVNDMLNSKLSNLPASHEKGQEKNRRTSMFRKFGRRMEGYFFVLPAVIFMLLLIGYPLLYNIILSFPKCRP